MTIKGFTLRLILCIVVLTAVILTGCDTTDGLSGGSGSELPSTGNNEMGYTQVTGSQGLEFGYSYETGGYIVMGIGSCIDSNLVIPNTYKGLPVVAIDDAAFFNCNGIQSLTIPDGIVSIGADAFKNCSALQNITITDTVTYIGRWAFRATPYFDNETNWYDGALYVGNHLVEVTNKIPVYFTVREGTKCIATGAFLYRSEIESVVLPDSVTAISDEVFTFEHRKLRNVSIGNGIKAIGEDNFVECENLVYTEKDNALYLGSEGSPYSVLVKAKGLDIKDCAVAEGTRVIYDCAFEYCDALTTVSIPQSVITLGHYVFNGCSSLASLEIPSHITKIDNGLVSGCSALKSFTIPQGVSVIGQQAFWGCKEISEIAIPDNVSYIGMLAFADCEKLTDVRLPDELRILAPNTFLRSASLSSITVSADHKCFSSIDGNLYSKDGKTLFLYAAGKTEQSFTVPNGVTKIGEYAFSYSSSLTEVIIPDSVTEIDSKAFMHCAGLNDIVLPESLQALGDEAFYGCDSITSIILPAGVTTVGKNPFPATLDKLLYGGSYDDWEAMSKDENLNYTLYGHIYYYYESEPDYVSKWWYYDENGEPTIVEEEDNGIVWD